MINKRINIFISHSWNNEKGYQDIINLLKKNNIGIGDFSVPESKSLGDNLNDLYLEQKLKNRIKNCSIFIISCNADLIVSEWVRREVKLASSYDKYILGIRPKGQKMTFDPLFIKKAIEKGRGKIINYNSKRVLQVIQNLTRVELKKLTKTHLKTKKIRQKRRRKFWIRTILYSLSLLLFLFLSFKLLCFLKPNKDTPTNNITPGISLNSQHSKIILVQNFVSQDSALVVKRKYHKRNFEVIKIHMRDSSIIFYVSVIDLDDQNAAERVLRKLRNKKTDWQKAEIVSSDQVCSGNLVQHGLIYQCK